MVHEMTFTNVTSFRDLGPWLLATGTAAVKVGFRIALILLIGYAAVRFVHGVIKRIEDIVTRASEATETVPGSARKRVATLAGLLRTIADVLVWSVAGITILSQIGLDIAPILAGAGIVGLAVGFGAQNLVRDVLSGFFLILENQVRVGDVAIINGTGGLVETITYRIVVLRDLAGIVHVFPNGSITTLANMTKGWSAYVMDIGVAYKEDTDKVVAIMKEVAEELQQDQNVGPKMLGPLEVFGVDEFGESAVTIKSRLRTLPGQQWDVGREYRRRLKQAFDARGIEIPFPHLSLYTGTATTPLKVQVEGAFNQQTRSESVP